MPTAPWGAKRIQRVNRLTARCCALAVKAKLPRAELPLLCAALLARGDCKPRCWDAVRRLGGCETAAAEGEGALELPELTGVGDHAELGELRPPSLLRIRVSRVSSGYDPGYTCKCKQSAPSSCLCVCDNRVWRCGGGERGTGAKAGSRTQQRGVQRAPCPLCTHKRLVWFGW